MRAVVAAVQLRGWLTMTIALPHLFWSHYCLIALIPGLWLLNVSLGPSDLPLCGLGSRVPSSRLQNVLFLPLDWMGVVAGTAALSWVPLWGGTLLRLQLTGRQGTEVVSVPSPAEKLPERRSAEAPSLHHPSRAKSPSHRPGMAGSPRSTPLAA